MITGHVRPNTTAKRQPSYQIVIEYDRDPVTGKRNRTFKTVHCSKKQADAMLRKMLSAAEAGELLEPSSMKLSDWMREWLDNYLPNLEATTRAGYEERIKTCLVPYLGAVPLKSLQTTAVQKWINDLRDEKGLAPKSIKNVYHNLDAALKKAVTLQMIPRNPCTGVELPKLEKYQAEIYNSDEITTLLKAAEGTDMYLLVLLTVSVGFRRGELAALSWDDIDFENGIIHIHSNRVIAKGKVITKAPKSKAGIRDVTIGQGLLDALKKANAQYLLNKRTYGTDFIDSNLVICQPSGKPFNPDSITQKWERFVEQKGLKHIRLHDLRHSCATAMIEAGIDPKTAQHRLGHSDVNITMNIYAHSTQTMDKKAADKMDELIFDKASGDGTR